MYTDKNYHDDVKNIAVTYYVKAALIKDMLEGRTNYDTFLETLKEKKTAVEIQNILEAMLNIQQKIQQNGNKLDKDPSLLADKLKKEGKLKEAYLTISPALQTNPHNEDYRASFFWIMYAYLKDTQHHPEQYYRCLKNLNAHIRFDLTNEKEKEWLNTVLWNIYRFISIGEYQANLIFDEFTVLCNHSNEFIERNKMKVISIFSGRTFTYEDFNHKKSLPASRILIKKFSELLEDQKFFALFDMIGFDWLEDADYKERPDKNNPEKMYPALAETILGTYAKRLTKADEVYATSQRLEKAIELLTVQIRKNPSYEWLPYYKIKLLTRANQQDKAFQELTIFARKKHRDFWIWDLMSTFVAQEDAFNCLCMALCTKAKDDMLCKTQEKIIPLLLEKEMFAEAKYELDKLLATRKQKNWKISQQHLDWQQENWYDAHEAAQNRDTLKVYALKAEEIIYRTLPYQDVFVSYINEEKQVVNFIYIDEFKNPQDGYFYMDDLLNHDITWQVDQPFKLKMFEDAKKKSLFKVFDVQPGDEAFVSHFIKEDYGLVSRESYNDFAFVDNVYIPAFLVKKYQLNDFETIKYVKKRNYNKKRSEWGWKVIDILATEDNLHTFEEEIIE